MTRASRFFTGVRDILTGEATTFDGFSFTGFGVPGMKTVSLDDDLTLYFSSSILGATILLAARFLTIFSLSIVFLVLSADSLLIWPL